MKLRAFMQHAFVRGIAVVMALVIVGGAVDWGHVGGDDPDCDLVGVVQSGTPGHFSAAPVHAPQSENHCYICHALRLLHAALAVRAGWASAATGSAPLLHPSVGIVRISDGVARTPRAPPAVLL